MGINNFRLFNFEYQVIKMNIFSVTRERKLMSRIIVLK
jgi:hypothetical protein